MFVYKRGFTWCCRRGDERCWQSAGTELVQGTCVFGVLPIMSQVGCRFQV
jgi:hypothetical protein